MPRWTALVAVFGLSLLTQAGARGQSLLSDENTFFETKIRPVLAQSCVKCHGPTKASGGLRLDTREAILKGGDSGPAVMPGDVESSLLVTAIQHKDGESLQMPPDKPLRAEVVSDLTRWIASGAKWPAVSPASGMTGNDHWAFRPIQKVIPPSDGTPGDDSGWAEHSIDRFIAAGQRQHRVRPVVPADKLSLLRRATFDLIGLPPTPEQIEAFLSDGQPDAFARCVEQLLASPQYGERWGRHWLDLVRYADTAGDNSDYPIPQAYLYRDYVLDAFNADTPYDRFLHEQLAGDILARDAPPDDYQRLVIATGLIAHAKRIGTRELEDIHLIIEDTVATIGPVVLGLSLRCARCHDHKYDPITQEDYYGLYGFFASTQYPFAGAEEVRKQTHFAPLIHPDELRNREQRRNEVLVRLKSEIEQQEKSSEVARRIRELDVTITACEEQLKSGDIADRVEKERKLTELNAERKKAREKLDEQLKGLRDELAVQEKEDPLRGVVTAYAVGELKPTDVSLQINGDPRTPGKVVPRGVPKILATKPLAVPTGVSGRLQLARWMTEEASFLSARVMANRIWQYHFGKPLVPTPSDYGFRGTPPTHPELLDWLANEFIASGWSMKAMHRRIMLSKTYQLSTTLHASNAEIDRGNAWYWRFDRRRLDAESLRDTMLVLGDSLNWTRPGPHPFPSPSKWRFTAHHQFNPACYPSDHRSVYLMVQRLHAHPYLSLFNGPDASLSTPVRDTSTVPLQALFLLNNELVHQQSRGFARTLIGQSADPVARIRLAFLRAFARPPTETEKERSMSFVSRYEAALEQEGMEKSLREIESWAGLARTLMAANEFFYLE